MMPYHISEDWKPALLGAVCEQFTVMCHALFRSPTQSVRPPTNAHNKMHFITSIKLLHVSEPWYHPQGVLEQMSICPTH